MGMQDKEQISTDGPVVGIGPGTVVLDDDGRVLDPATDVGKIGRLARGGNVPVGYYKDPEKSAKTFLEIDGQRYSVPGDMARIEEGNRITLLGRGSNCVNTGGEKVYPEEVEMAIKSHPAVYDCLVVGIPDEKYGQAVAAVVELREGTTLELDELRDFLRAHLSGYKLPRSLTSCPRSRATPPARRSTPPPRRWLLRTSLCDEFGIDYPIFAFTPSEHVAAAVSRAGGLGVLGCVRFNDTEELERVLTWLDDNTDGKPYGVDIVMPMKIPTEGTSLDLGAMIPEEHRKFVDETLLKLGVPPLPEGEGREGVLGWLHSVARSHLDVALQHRPVLIANALGSPPVDVIEKCHEHGIKVAALAGAAKHALSHVRERRRHHRRPGLRGRRPHRRGRLDGAHPRHRGRGRPRRTRPRRRRHRLRPPGRRVARAGRPGCVDGLDLARHRGVPRDGRQQRGLGDRVHPGHVQRHRPHPGLHRQAGPAAQDEVDRGLDRGGRSRRRSRCRCRTCWSPRRTTGSAPPTTPTSSRCRSARSSAG